jgi:3-isopropylmalate/(R)-2-methylmalate dehydratase small subunit
MRARIWRVRQWQRRRRLRVKSSIYAPGEATVQKFDQLTAIAAPLLIDNIDTDQLIPVHRMLASMRPDYGAGLFANWRYINDKDPNPDFILNQPPYTQAGILIAGENFACGSSREHAVWALQGFGIRCVIAMSFGDIFFNNCFKQGVLPIILAAPTIRALAAEVTANGGCDPLSVSLVDRRIYSALGTTIDFAIDDGLREILINGLDEIGQTLLHEAEISAFQARDRLTRPWIYNATPAAMRRAASASSPEAKSRG